MTEDLIGQLGYVGIILLLVLGGLGLPVPEEAPVILAAVLSKKGTMWWPLALASCFVGVLAGDFVVYFLGYFYGERVLSFPLTRKFLTRAREVQIKGYFHRHGFKILILGRFAVGFRTAAYLTAGILRLPALKLFLTDLVAASLSTLLLFGLGWQFAEWIESGLREAKHWIFVLCATALILFLVYRYYQGRRRAGLLVGPRVLVSDEADVPPEDHPHPPKPEPLPELPPAPPVPAPPPADRNGQPVPAGPEPEAEPTPSPEPSPSETGQTISTEHGP